MFFSKGNCKTGSLACHTETRPRVKELFDTNFYIVPLQDQLRSRNKAERKGKQLTFMAQEESADLCVILLQSQGNGDSGMLGFKCRLKDTWRVSHKEEGSR